LFPSFSSPTKILHTVCGGVWQHCALYTLRATQSTRTDVLGKLDGSTVTYRPLFKNYETVRRVTLQIVPFILLWDSNTFHSTLFWHTLNLCSSLMWENKKLVSMLQFCMFQVFRF
jgi:hypothetical protein